MNRSRICAALLAAVGLLAMSPGAIAEEPPSGDAVSAAIEDLRREMAEMKRAHAEETQALREEIRALRGGEVEAPPPGSELEELLRAADEQAAEAEAGGTETDRPFVARGLGLQALNPEISLAGDMQLIYVDREDRAGRSDFRFRVLDIHIESYLDPYTKMKAAVGVFEDGADLGEAYLTRFGILPGLSVTAGKFRQQFGVVNRWHKHALDQIEFPLALTSIFGGGGLNQVGLSLEQSIPEVLGGSQILVLQVTDGQNGSLFGENERNMPSVLLRASNFRDLTKDTYVEVGLTGLLGWNDEWEVRRGDGVRTLHDRRATFVLGGDLTVRWEPTDDMRSSGMEWRTEVYALSRGIVAPDGAAETVQAWGAYTSLERKLSRTVDVGVRLDWFAPDSMSDVDDFDYGSHAVRGSGPYRWQVCPYVTWWQSPFVKVRFEVDYADGRHTGPGEMVLGLQVVFAAGPHKHERY